MGRIVFRKYGGSVQLSIKSFEDLEKAMEVPETLWVATACPTSGFACDKRFLEFLDTDKNGRIRAEELKAAVRWVAAMLKDRSGGDDGSSTLKLEKLSDEAGDLRKSAELVQKVLKLQAGSVSLDQVKSSENELRAQGYNGDGIVAAETMTKPGLAELIQQILAVLPGGTNRAGKKGVDEATIQAFREGKLKGIARMDARAEVFVWGEETLDRASQLEALAPKLEEYFLQCRLVAVQPEAGPLLRLSGDRIPGVLGDREALDKISASLLIAPLNPQLELRWGELHKGLHFEALQALRKDVFEPILGEQAKLTEAEFQSIRAKAARALAWKNEAAQDKVIALGDDLRGVDDKLLDELSTLCAEDLGNKPLLDSLEKLEQLLLYQRWLLEFANNFVAMPNLYHLKRKALFEQGRLILGGRLFTLAVSTPDRAAHSALASTNTMCLAYLKLERQGIAAPAEVVVPVTSGTSESIAVGKRGIFYDRDENEYDATITQVVLQPVSLWEAMTMPFSRIGKFISSKVQGFGESGDKAMEAKLAAPAPAPAAPAAAGAAPASPLGGTIAAGGLAFAAVGSAAAFIVNQLKALTILDLVRATIAILLLIMVPAGVLGWWKLRQRNLAVLLEGSGWALNDRLMLTRPLGNLFTRRPPRPANSSVDYTDLIPTIEVGDEPEDNPGKKALITFLVVGVLATLLWEFREPLMSGAKLLVPQPAASGAPPAASK